MTSITPRPHPRTNALHWSRHLPSAVAHHPSVTPPSMTSMTPRRHPRTNNPHRGSANCQRGIKTNCRSLLCQHMTHLRLCPLSAVYSCTYSTLSALDLTGLESPVNTGTDRPMTLIPSSPQMIYPTPTLIRRTSRTPSKKKPIHHGHGPTCPYGA